MYSLLHSFLVKMISLLGKEKQKDFIHKRIFQEYKALPKTIEIWIHASSVGEVNLLERFLLGCLEAFEGEI